MKYKIQLGDKSLEFRASDFQSFRNELCYANSDDFRFFVDGNEVNRDQAFAACSEALAAKIQKKEKTHKKIYVPDGISGLKSKPVWVKK